MFVFYFHLYVDSGTLQLSGKCRRLLGAVTCWLMSLPLHCSHPSAGNWAPGLLHFKETFCSWATSPSWLYSLLLFSPLPLCCPSSPQVKGYRVYKPTMCLCARLLGACHHTWPSLTICVFVNLSIFFLLSLIFQERWGKDVNFCFNFDSYYNRKSTARDRLGIRCLLAQFFRNWGRKIISLKLPGLH